MMRKRTRVLQAAPSFCLASGFLAQVVFSGGPGLSLANRLDSYTTIWTFSLIVLGYAAAVVSLLRPREWTLMLGAALRWAIAAWVLAIAMSLFFDSPHHLPHFSMEWWKHRGYHLFGALLGLAAGFMGQAWDISHFHLPNIQLEAQLQQKLGEMDDLQDDVPEET